MNVQLTSISAGNMGATDEQIELIDALLESGCPIPEHPIFDRPDDTMYDSVEAADKFIKENQHYLERKHTLIEISNRISAGEWGGIPNS